MLRRFTILVIPEGTHSVKRFSFHGFLAPVFLVSFLASIFFGGYWYYQYRSIQADLPNVQALQTQNQRQEAQINAFARGLASLKDQIIKVKSFNQRLRVMANLDKKTQVEPVAGVGGPDGAMAGPGVRLANTTRERQIGNLQREMAEVSAQAEVEQALQEELAKFLGERRSILASTPSLWPVRGWVTSGFGYRTSPWTGKRHFHAGLDISTRVGTPVVAPADGVVTFAGQEGAYGNMLVINHGRGVVTRYGHLHTIKVKAGQQVRRGQLVAQVGNTGRSTGSHLHYEVMVSGVPANPRYYLVN